MKRRNANGKFRKADITETELMSKPFGHLTFVCFVEPGPKGVTRCKWKCDCGNEKICNLWHVLSNDTKSCGCLRHRKHNQSPNWNGYGDLSGNVWNRIKHNAKSRDIPFLVTPKEVWDCFVKQNRKCALSGVDLQFDSGYGKSDGNASLDRIDSAKPYTADNIQWVHKHVNNIKWDFSEKELLEWVEKIYAYRVKSFQQA